MDHGLPPALQLLARVKNPVADEALVAAVPHLEGDVLAAVVDLLIKRENTPGLVELLRCRRAAPASLDPLLTGRVNELHPALSSALVESHLDDRLGAISLIALSRDTRSADLLAGALRHTCSRTRQAAADALVGMAEHVLSQPRCASPEDVERFRLHALRLSDAVCSALEVWRQHHQPGVLQLALRLIPMTQAFVLRAADETGTPLGHALQRSIEEASDPNIAEAVVRSLAVPALRAAAAHAISHASGSAFIAAILKAAWLVADPSVRHGCRLIRKSEWGHEWVHALCALDASGIAAAMSFVAAAGGSTEAKADLLRRLLAESSPSARRAAFWQAIHDAAESPVLQLLQSLAIRTDEDLARVAELECSRLQRSSTARAPSNGPPGLLQPPAADSADSLRKSLRDSNPMERVRALAAIEAAHAPASFRDDILRLLRDPSPAVRSAAVSLLGAMPVTNPSYLLRQSLNDEDARVQANAVEVADTLRLRDLLPVVAQRMSSSDARLRANAVKFCAQEGLHEAGEALIAMLESPSAAHRRSALWVAEKLRLHSLLPRIEQLASIETDPVVRRLAARVAHDLAPRQAAALQPAGGPSEAMRTR